MEAELYLFQKVLSSFHCYLSAPLVTFANYAAL